jgi:GNAT superfamily N-acetyltransferase
VDDGEVRACTVEDGAKIDRFYERLSPESSYTRFFCGGADAYKRATRGEGERVVLVVDRGGEIVAIGEYYVSSADRAEVAFAVLDSAQHHGLATRLLHDLRVIAEKRGLRELTAQVLATNGPMMNVFRHSGLPYRSKLRAGVYDVVLTLEQPSER